MIARFTFRGLLVRVVLIAAFFIVAAPALSNADDLEEAGGRARSLGRGYAA